MWFTLILSSCKNEIPFLLKNDENTLITEKISLVKKKFRSV
jgi:hypothetical protein